MLTVLGSTNSIEYRVQGIKQRTCYRTAYSVQGTGYKVRVHIVQGTEYRVQGTDYRVQGTGYRVKGTG